MIQQMIVDNRRGSWSYFFSCFFLIVSCNGLLHVIFVFRTSYPPLADDPAGANDSDPSSSKSTVSFVLIDGSYGDSRTSRTAIETRFVLIFKGAARKIKAPWWEKIHPNRELCILWIIWNLSSNRFMILLFFLF